MQHTAERGTTGRQVAVVDRDPARRHVPARVPDVQLGEQHGEGLRQGSAPGRAERRMAGQMASMMALKRALGRMAAVTSVVVGLVVAADVDRRSLHLVELVDDGVLVGAQRLGNGREARRQLGVVGLARQLARPVERQVEVAAAVVELVHLALAASGSRRAPNRWRGRACRRAAARSRCRSSARGTRATPPARGTRPASPSGGGSPSRTAARAWAPNRRRRSRTARRRS